MPSRPSSRTGPRWSNRLSSLQTTRRASDMPQAYYLAALDTILAVLVTFGLGGYVGHLRHKLKIEPPATTGHPQFERAFRAHTNTVENLVLVLPVLWVAAVFWGG